MRAKPPAVGLYTEPCVPTGGCSQQTELQIGSSVFIVAFFPLITISHFVFFFSPNQSISKHNCLLVLLSSS